MFIALLQRNVSLERRTKWEKFKQKERNLVFCPVKGKTRTGNDTKSDKKRMRMRKKEPSRIKKNSKS